MDEILDAVEAWHAEGDRFALATVVATRRSAPRPTGAKMLINEHGQIAGAVSGGCVEGAVVTAAYRVFDTGIPRLLHFGIADEAAFEVGLPCGGEIDVFIEEHLATATSPQVEFLRRARSGRRAALATVIGPETATGLARKMLVTTDRPAAGGLGEQDVDVEAREVAAELLWTERSETREFGGLQVFIDVVAPAPRLLILGAVDYAAALCRFARVAGWRPFVCDPRSAFATEPRFSEAERVVAAWPDEAFARLGIDRATYIAVLTHDPKLDDAALRIALRSEAAYVGAMGSRPAQKKRRERLLEQGLTESELARMSAPIGLDLGASGPEETALSIMAEVAAVRNGREGGRLRARAGPIHEASA